MRKLLLVLLLLSQSAFAENHIYAGASVLMDNITNWQEENIDEYDKNDVGFSIFGGINKPLSSQFDLGLELEYQYIEQAEFLSTISLDADSFYINLRPRFSDNLLYAELIFGVGLLQGERTNLASGLSDSDSNISYQFGLEFGYQLKALSLDFGVGYRVRSVELDEVELSIRGLMANIKYHF